MNVEHARLWLDTVLGGLSGWINLRAIDPDQKTPPRTEMLQTTGEALAWCERWDGRGFNLYAGLARRGEARDEAGKIDASERNLSGLNVLWCDLDDGTREEQQARADAFPIRPALTIDSGGGLHLLWKLDLPIECASDPETNARLRRVLKGIQVAIGGDPAVVDPSRIFRVAGTRNYPNARKRAKGRVACESSILRVDPYSVTLEDFADYEWSGEQEERKRPHTVHGQTQDLSIAIDHILSSNKRMRRIYFCEQRLYDGDASKEDYWIAYGMLRRAPWIDDSLVIDALRYRREALAHLVRGSAKSRTYYASTVRKARERLENEKCAPDFERFPGRWFQFVLGKAISAQPVPEVSTELAIAEQPPRIETGIGELDERTSGGVYGFTALAGDSGVGKSTIAFNTALHAYAAGWKVLYIAAEMDAADYQERAARYFGCRQEEVLARLPIIAHVSDGVRLEALYDLVMTLPDDETTKVLLVLDSLTKIAAYVDAGSEGFGFFHALGKLTRLCESAVRWGERRVAAIATSELNKDRASLGRRITYAASLEILLMKDKDAPELVSIAIPKARYSPAQKSFGPYEYVWQYHRLQKIGGVPSDHEQSAIGLTPLARDAEVFD